MFGYRNLGFGSGVTASLPLEVEYLIVAGGGAGGKEAGGGGEEIEAEETIEDIPAL